MADFTLCGVSWRVPREQQEACTQRPQANAAGHLAHRALGSLVETPEAPRPPALICWKDQGQLAEPSRLGATAQTSPKAEVPALAPLRVEGSCDPRAHTCGCLTWPEWGWDMPKRK